VARFSVAAIPLFLIPALGAVQGGFQPDSWVWSGALAAWAAALGLVLGGSGRLRRDYRWVIAAGALVLWTLASALWSAEPAQSVLEARRVLVYGAVVLAFVVLARRDSSRVLLAATHAGIVVLVLYALLRYLLGSRTYIEFEGRLLAQPLGYANAIGILAAMAILLSLGRAAESSSVRLRAAAGASVPLLALALELTGSDASLLALALGFVGMAALQPNRRALVLTVAAVLPGTLVAAWLGRHSDLTSLSAPRIGGLAVAFAAAACAALSAVATARLSTAGPARAPRRPRLAFTAAMSAIVLGALAVGVAGAPEPRSSYYHVAWHEYLAHPLLGSGAGTFGRYWLESGRVARWGGALDAHSLYVETLAELGPIGLLLVAAFVLYPLARAVTRRGAPGVAPAAGASVAFLVHAGLDWDWELPAVVVAGLACAAVVLFAEQEGEGADVRPAPGLGRAVALAVALLAGVASIAGARSTAEPAAASFTDEAPLSGASIDPPTTATRYLPW
jgi:hypothetical protein